VRASSAKRRVAAKRTKKAAPPERKAAALATARQEDRSKPKGATEPLANQFANVMTWLGSPWPAAIAVSAGGDSVALMFLLADWAAREVRSAPIVLTVDHGLRPDSHKDAEHVRKLARSAGLEAHVLVWKGAKPSADIEAEARAARYRLMGAWCAEKGAAALYLAHTMEDQAETFLLRLSRGSGLDGLSGMRSVAPLPLAEFSGVKLARPLLGIRRDELRTFLKNRGETWREDPMNADPRFARSRLRAEWPALEKLGLTIPRVADAANHLARAREALEESTDSVLQRAVRMRSQEAVLDPLRLKMQPREIGLRVLATVLSQVSGEPYRPRFDSLERLFDSVVAGNLGGGATLHGCKIGPAPVRDQVFGSATLTISREPTREAKEPSARAARRR